MRRECLFDTERCVFNTFCFAPIVEECPTLGKTQSSSLSANQSQWRRGGTNTTPTNRHTLLVLRLNNNGEVNIACLQILISLPDGIPKLPQYYEKWCLEKHFIRSASAIFHILWYSISLQPIKASQLKRSALKRSQLGVFCRVTQPYSHIVVGSIAI